MIRGKKIYIIGIGGTGMSPIALVLNQMGAIVSGSDRSESDYTARLRSQGVCIHLEQKAENIQDADIVLYSSAVKKENPELAEALHRGIPAYKRSEFLSTMLSERKVVAIAGTHGKSSTTAMTAFVLRQLEQDPGFIIGSVSKDLGTNAAAGSGDAFVIEADEYDRMFHGLNPFIALLTKLEYDHPDCYPTWADYCKAFEIFLSKTAEDGVILLNADDPNQKPFAEAFEKKTVTFGIQEPCSYRARDLQLQSSGCYRFECLAGDENVPVRLSVPGLHNVYNALAVLAICGEKGLSLTKAAKALEKYSGIARRFEITENWNGITLVDDYGHHPTEIQATLSAAKEMFPGRRIIAVWQPHTFSRTRELLDEFAVSFDKADLVVLTDIFAAREKKTDFDSTDVLKAIRHDHVTHTGTVSETAEFLSGCLKSGDVVVTLSAGDANQAAPMALEKLKHVSD